MRVLDLGQQDFSQQDRDRLEEQRRMILRKFQAAALTAGVVGAVVLGAGSGFIIWGSSKWKEPWNMIGIVIGTLAGIGAMTVLGAGLAGRWIFEETERQMEKPRLQVKADTEASPEPVET